jgi:hypothetical protein
MPYANGTHQLAPAHILPSREQFGPRLGPVLLACYLIAKRRALTLRDVVDQRAGEEEKREEKEQRDRFVRQDNNAIS